MKDEKGTEWGTLPEFGLSMHKCSVLQWRTPLSYTGLSKKAPNLKIMQQNPAHVQCRPTSIPTFTVPCVTQAVNMTTVTTIRKQIVYTYVVFLRLSKPMKARGKFSKLFLGPSKLKLYKRNICTYLHFWNFQIKCHIMNNGVTYLEQEGCFGHCWFIKCYNWLWFLRKLVSAMK